MAFSQVIIKLTVTYLLGMHCEYIITFMVQLKSQSACKLILLTKLLLARVAQLIRNFEICF